MTSLNDLAVNRLCRGQGQYGRTVLPLIFSIHQTADGYQHHGSFTLARFSRNRPHCLRRFYHARTVVGQEYHCAYRLSSPYREPPDTDSRLLFAPCRKSKAKDLFIKTGEISLLPFSANRGAAANVAYAHHNSNRNVFDEWVFSCKRANPFTAQNGKQAESFRTSPPVSSLKA